LTKLRIWKLIKN